MIVKNTAVTAFYSYLQFFLKNGIISIKILKSFDIGKGIIPGYITEHSEIHSQLNVPRYIFRDTKRKSTVQITEHFISEYSVIYN
jgi:hypothetical protein